MHALFPRSLFAAALAAPVLALAATVSVSPVGEVAQVRQVTAKFSEPVVPLGDLRLADPFTLACEGKVPPGAGRWVDDRAWVYDFQEALPPRRTSR